MIIDKKNKEINIRMGKDYTYISYIMLNDGTRLINMQCSLTAPTPTEEQLQAFENSVRDTYHINTKAEIERLKHLKEMGNL